MVDRVPRQGVRARVTRALAGAVTAAVLVQVCAFVAPAVAARVPALVPATPATTQAAAPADRTSRVDALFAAWSATTPGCTVGVAENGRSVLARAYGMADLEHDVPNRADTIIEAGSVSKQFTAAAILLLAQDGKLSLDDPVHKYVPELQGYGAPVTIRHLLSHTSGLRDWGSLAGLAGWPRGNRMHTHAHVVDILSRQRTLNFAPGTRWSYSNSGYNLAAVIVDRVSGMSFAQFSRTRIFAPLGLTRTSWRDDYTRVVKDRAIAYVGGGPGGFRQDMPFENVHGNGGLLTTVGDLLTWSERLASPPAGWRTVVEAQIAPAALADGRPLHYGLGVFVGSYKGVPEIYHSGSTAGYRAFLTFFPEPRVAVAVLCNAGGANATQLAHAVSDVFLGDRVTAGAPGRPTLTEARGPLVGVAADPMFKPDAAALADYAGVYESDEIETTLQVEVSGDRLVVRRRPAQAIALRPHSRDRFEGGSLGLVTFHRTAGRVTALGVTQDRVWDLRFDRAASAPGRAAARR